MAKFVWDQAVKVIKKPVNWFHEKCEDPTGLIGRVGSYKYINENGQHAFDFKRSVLELTKFDLGYRYHSLFPNDDRWDDLMRPMMEETLKREIEQFLVPLDHLEGYVQPLPHGTKVRIIADHPNWPRHTCAYPEIGIKGVVAHRRPCEVMTPPWGAVTVKIRARALGYDGGEPIYYHLSPECLEIISK